MWQHCVPVLHKIMGYHTVNVYYAVVRNTQLLLYLLRRQINMLETCVQQYVFMLTPTYHILLFMAYAHTRKGKYVLCVTLILVLQQLAKYTHEMSFSYLKPQYQNFMKKYNTPEIQKLVFHFPHVRILERHHRGKQWHETFKLRIIQHDVLCWRNYTDQIISSFSHQIQSG